MKRLRQLNQEATMMRRVIWRTIKEQWQVDRSLLIINFAFIPLAALLPLAASWLAGDALNKLVASLQGHVSSNQVYTAFGLAATVGLLSSMLGPVQRHFRDN